MPRSDHKIKIERARGKDKEQKLRNKKKKERVIKMQLVFSNRRVVMKSWKHRVGRAFPACCFTRLVSPFLFEKMQKRIAMLVVEDWTLAIEVYMRVNPVLMSIFQFFSLKIWVKTIADSML